LTFILDNSKFFKNIFVHNLGSFDGIFIYKAISKFFLPEEVSTIIDDKNRFIQIQLKGKYNICYRDSYRVFPVSLDNLCSNFNVIGKTSKYDIEYNSLELFNKPNLLKTFKNYALQDAKALLKALINAQEIYLENYEVDIATSLSTSNLSMKIFRRNFQIDNINILKTSEDVFIRKGYYGGCTDYYKAYVKLANYKDVNSLYPEAMKKPMPDKIIKFHHDLSTVNLNDFFGYLLVEVETPKNILKPLLPYRYEGRTIQPTGS
jgi:hypothetical protein